MRRVVASLNPANREHVSPEDNSGDKSGKLWGQKWRTLLRGETLGTIEFAETASQRRAITYRERATHLSNLAHTEPNGSLCTKLLELSTQYEELARSLRSIPGRDEPDRLERGARHEARAKGPTLPLHIFEHYLRHLRGEQARLLAEREPYKSCDERRAMTADGIPPIH